MVSSCCKRKAEEGELAFIKAISNVDLSPVFLQELRKAVAAGKKKKAPATSRHNAMSPSAFKCHSGVGSKAWTSRCSSQLHVRRRKAE